MLTAVFLAPWWRSFLGLTLDGYFPYYGHLVLQGEIPYRDFFLHLPPLHALLDAGVEWFCGPSILALRVVGALGRLAMAVVLALWLRLSFRSGPALFGALAAVFLASGDDTEILDLYNFHALLAAALAGLAIAYALDGRRPGLLWFLAGFGAALAFWTKQTIGLNATLAVFLLPAILAWRDPSARALLPRRLGQLALGWLPPGLAIGGWLAANGAWPSFLRQVFIDAGASKGGSTLGLILRPWLDPWRLAELRWPAAIALGCGLLLTASLLVPETEAATTERNGRYRGLWLAFAAVAALLLLSHVILHPVANQPWGEWLSRAGQRVGVLLTSFTVPILAGVLVVRAARRPLFVAEQRLLALALFAGGCGSALAFSWPAGEGIAYPGLGLVAAFALDGAPRRPWLGWLRWPALAATATAVLAALVLKLIVPFDFAGWREPSPEDATHLSAEPALAGMRLGVQTRDALDGTLELIRRAAPGPDQEILVFPDLPIFYWLAERPRPTFAALSWFDVTPDRVVEEDLLRIRANPPVVIVFQEISPGLLEINEAYFRGGRESAVRRLQAELIRLADGYVVGAYYEPWRFYPALQVWVRRDRAAELGIED